MTHRTDKTNAFGARYRRGCVVVLASGILILSAVSSAAQPPTVSGPLTLSDAVQTALKHSPMLQAAAYQAAAADARAGMARAMTRPQLSVTAFGGTSDMGDVIASPPNVMPSSLITFPDRTAVSGQLALMFPLHTGGRLSGAARGARALSAAAASDKATVERNVALEARTAYHAALLARATVDLYTSLVKEAEERVRTADASFREGRIAKYDLLRNQADLADARQRLAGAERDAQVALVDLKAVLGVSQSSEITLTDGLTYAQVTGGLETYTASAEKRRPELLAARHRVKSAEADVEVGRSTYKPQVYAAAMSGLMSTSGGTDTGVTVGIGIGIPLLDGGQRRAAVKEAEAMLEAMRQGEQQVLVAVQRDVNAVWAELQAAERNVQLSLAAIEHAEEDYRVVKLRYEAGKAVNVEVLDALASLVRARNNQLMALYEHNVARDRLAWAIGEP